MTTQRSSSRSRRSKPDTSKPIVFVQAGAQIKGQGLLTGASISRFNNKLQPVEIKVGTTGMVVDDQLSDNELVKVAFEHGGRATVELDVPRVHLNF